MRYLSTVYIRSNRGQVKVRDGSLLVKTPEGSQRIPLKAVDALVILGSSQITTQALDACVNQGIRVAALKRSGALRFVVNARTGGNVNLRMALYRTVSDDQLSLALAKSIVAAKIQNSRRVIERWSRDEKSHERRERLAKRAAEIRGRISRIGEASTPDQVRGIEGDVARIYFRSVGEVLESSELGFSKRTRRPPRDPVNSVLGFCYSMLVTEFIGAMESVGLDYQMGFFHRPRAGRPSLALDLTEELRAVTDRFIVSLVRRRQLVGDDFEVVPGGAVYLTEDGRGKLMNLWERHKDDELEHQLIRRPIGRWALPSVQATLLARYLRGDLPDYPPFVLT